MISATDAWLVDERWFKAYPLGEETTIGRGPRNTIIVRDPAVSRVHATVAKEPAGYLLRAYGSSGTKVNGIPVPSQCLLQEGDVVEIAFTNLLFTRKAPTGEMFVTSRDAPTSMDQLERATSITLHAMHPIVFISRWRRHWHWILIAAVVVGVVAICAGRSH